MARQFGEAVVNERWQEAYGLCTASFQAERPLESFVGDMQTALREYHQFGKPLRCDANLEASDPREVAESFELPPRMNAEKLVAWVCDYMVLELDGAGTEDEQASRHYELNLVLVEDQGQRKISYLDFAWGD